MFEVSPRQSSVTKVSEEVGSHGSGGPLEWSSSIDGRPKQLVSPSQIGPVPGDIPRGAALDYVWRRKAELVEDAYITRSAQDACPF